MASVVGVCNSALQKLGAARITSLSDDSKNARACNAAYERVRDALLRRHTWSFSIKRAQLAADSSDPAFGPAKQYSVPSDFIRLLPPDPDDNVNDLDWKIEGRKILTSDTAPLDVRYVYRVTDPNDMDTLFLEVWAAALAADICEEITQSNTKKEALRQDLKELLAEARRANAIESVSAAMPEDVWITAQV